MCCQQRHTAQYCPDGPLGSIFGCYLVLIMVWHISQQVRFSICQTDRLLSCQVVSFLDLSNCHFFHILIVQYARKQISCATQHGSHIYTPIVQNSDKSLYGKLSVLTTNTNISTCITISITLQTTTFFQYRRKISLLWVAFSYKHYKLSQFQVSRR